jgi:hypothetical protein
MDMKQNMRWLGLVILLMFATTVTSLIIGHAIFIFYLKPDIDQFKECAIEEAAKEKLIRVEI